MKNHIRLVTSAKSHLLIGHNDHVVHDGWVNGVFELSVPECLDRNCFWIRNQGDQDVDIVTLSMFDHGDQRLPHLGVFTADDGDQWSSHVFTIKGVWRLHYDYPVFQWLHQVLHYGWYNRPWNYTKTAKMP